MQNPQLVRLTVDGISLIGEFATPDIIKEKYPTVCICHGVPSGRQPDPGDGGYPLLAEQIRRHGFATFIFNFRGSGTSGGNFDILGWTRDLQAVLDYLFTLPAVDTKHLSLLGFSGGAAVSVYTAARDARVSAVIACACPADFHMMTDPGILTQTISYFRKIGIIRDRDFPPSVEAWRDDFNRVSPVDCIDRLSPRPLLLIHSRDDKTVPVDNARRLYAGAGEPKKLVILDGAEHRLRNQDKAVSLIIDWLKMYLQDY